MSLCKWELISFLHPRAPEPGVAAGCNLLYSLFVFCMHGFSACLPHMLTLWRLEQHWRREENTQRSLWSLLFSSCFVQCERIAHEPWEADEIMRSSSELHSPRLQWRLLAASLHESLLISFAVKRGRRQSDHISAPNEHWTTPVAAEFSGAQRRLPVAHLHDSAFSLSEKGIL